MPGEHNQVETHVPARTCVGCRTIDKKEELERFVAFEHELVHDLRRKAPGRGVYVHPRIQCLQKALNGGFGRGFRKRIEAPSADVFVQQIADGIVLRISESLHAARRMGSLKLGFHQCQDAVLRERAFLLVLARNTGASTERKLSQLAAQAAVKVVRLASAETLGEWLGREKLSVLVLTDESLAKRLGRDSGNLGHLQAFEG